MKCFTYFSGGAGGKGVWGKLGSELEEDVIDMNDPNYDSDSLDNGDIELKKIIPEVSEEELRKGAEPIIQEYFEHGDTHEAALGFDELNTGTKRFMIVQIAIEIAMDHKPSHREMTSVLISDLYGRVISQRDMAKGECSTKYQILWTQALRRTYLYAITCDSGLRVLPDCHHK